MKVLIVAGLTCRVAGWIHRTTRHQVNAIVSQGDQAALVADVPVRDENRAGFFQMDFHGARRHQQLEEAIAAFQPDIIHVSCGGVSLLNSVDRISRLKQIPWMFTAHNIPPAERQLSRFYGRNRLHYKVRDILSLPSTFAWGRLLRRGCFDCLIVHSGTVKSRAIAGGCPVAKIRSVPFGADLAPTEMTAGPIDIPDSPFRSGQTPKLLTVAGMIHHKGLHDLLNAIAQLKPKFPKIHSVVIGGRRDRNYEKFIGQLISRLELKENVEILWNASDGMLATAWEQADVYVQPSHEEGFCLSFLEGIMAIGRAVGTRTGAMIEMAVDDPLVKIILPGDPSTLATAIQELVEIPAPVGNLIERQERLRRKFSWEQYESQHASAYSALAGAGTAGFKRNVE